MLERSTLAGIAGAFFLVAAGANPASAQCGPGCDGMANWSGLYIGAGVGGTFDSIGQDWSHYVNGVRDGWGVDDHRGGSGFIGTVGAGYDWQIRDRLVVGALADFDFGSAEHKEKDYWNGGQSDWTIKHNHSWTVGGRLGLLTTNTAMIYGLIGYSQADLDIRVHEDNAIDTATVAKDMTFSGLTLGAGLEQELGNGFFLKGEYRYTNFGDEDFGLHTEADDGTRNINTERDSFDLDTHSVRASLVYKFQREQAVEEVSYKDVPPASPYK